VATATIATLPGLVAAIGIIGFPNVGKTTLFNALTGLAAATAPHPFTTTEPNVGVARVPDPELERAAEVEKSAKIVFNTIDLSDLPAMAKQGHGGGFGPQYFGRLRDMEALAVVLRAFDDAAVPATESGTDPETQAEELLLELCLVDHEVFARRRDRIAREATTDPGKRPAAETVARATSILEGGTPLRAETWSAAERAALRDLAPLTLKPAVWLVNVAEDEPDPPRTARMIEEVVPAGDVVVAVSAKLEEEASRLAPEDRDELFAGLGLGAGALARFVQAAHHALGLLAFYTVGPKEAHAWTVRAGATVREAAGRIHSDLERGFIRAEVAPLDVVIENGGWDETKRRGHVRVEGKDHPISPGDVIVVRFSV